MFKNDLKLYIYPLLDRQTGELTTVENLQVAPELRKLYEYLVEKGCIEQLDNYNPAYLADLSRDVIEQIKAGDPAWSDHVPAEVAEVIRRRGFFGYKRPMTPTEPPAKHAISLANRTGKFCPSRPNSIWRKRNWRPRFSHNHPASRICRQIDCRQGTRHLATQSLGLAQRTAEMDFPPNGYSAFQRPGMRCENQRLAA